MEPNQTGAGMGEAAVSQPLATDGFPKAKEIFKGAWKTFRENFWKLQAFAWAPFGIMLGVILILAIPVVVTLFAFGVFNHPEAIMEIGRNVWLLVVLGLLILIAVVVGVLLSAWTQLAMIKTIAQPQLAFRDALRETKSKILPYFWVSIVSMTVVLGGLVLLVVPGIYLMLMFAFVMFVMVLEDERGLNALGKSYQYVKGNVWRLVKYALFGMLISLAIFVPALLMQMIFSIANIGELGQFFGRILQTLFAPLMLAYSIGVYLAFKSKKETGVVPMTGKQRKAFVALSILGIAAMILVPVVLVLTSLNTLREKVADATMRAGESVSLQEGLSVTLPEGWTQVLAETENAPAFAAYRADNGMSVNIVVVDAEEGLSTVRDMMTLEEYKSHLEAALGIADVQVTETTVNGMPAYKAVGNTSFQDIGMTMQQYTLLSSDRILIISFSGQGDMQDLDNEFGKVLEGIEIQ